MSIPVGESYIEEEMLVGTAIEFAFARYFPNTHNIVLIAKLSPSVTRIAK